MPECDTYGLSFGVRSDAGLVLETNEDAYAVPSQLPGSFPVRLGVFFAVADGMGGLNNGCQASQLATEMVFRAYYRRLFSSGSIPERLLSAIRKANRVIHKRNADLSAAGQMGSTIVCAVLLEEHLTVVNIGDTRAYLIRGNEIWQLTEDHSFVGGEVRAGLITSEQAKTHPRRSMISRYLGQADCVEPSIREEQLEAGDILVLCTDGLYVWLHDQEIQEIASSNLPDTAVEHLTSLAKQRGSDDNITVIVIRIPVLT